MPMIKYYNKLTSSISEINNSPTLLIHSLCGCNLKCYNCFNYEELVNKKHEEYYTIDDIVHYIKLNGYIYDYIVLSGGEFLKNKLTDIIHDIAEIKNICASPIIIYTNGTFPHSLRYFLEQNIINGFHTDLKLPFQYIDKNIDKGIIIKTLGTNVDIDDVLLSIEYTIQFDKGLNQIRSIKYPFLDDSVYNDNHQYINKLNKKYNKNVPYCINDFINEEANAIVVKNKYK